MEDLSLILTIGGVIQLITLIVFFVMANNVAELKGIVKNASCNKLSLKEYYDIAIEEKYIGNKEKSKECFLRVKYRAEKILGNEYLPEFSWDSKQLLRNIEKEIAEL